MNARAAILDEIVRAVRGRVERGDYRPPDGPDAKKGDGARFLASLRQPGKRIIAEIKRRSPSAGEILPDADHRLETVALAYRRGRAAAISVVTERDFFGGDPVWVARAARISGLPVLMKDFVVEAAQISFAAACGADAVLLIAAILDPDRLAELVAVAGAAGLAAVVEAHDADEVRSASASGAQVVGVNARDLRDFSVDREAPGRLAREIPEGVVRLAESGVRGRADVEAAAASGFSAFLVGEALLRSEDPESLLRELEAP